MKYLLWIIFGAFSISSAISGVDPTPIAIKTSETFDIKVVITNVKSQKGVVRLGLFNNSESFLNQGEEYKTYSKRPSGDELVFNLKDVKKGDYAISLYHDINDDNKCNLSFLLRPSEPYGFSNNIKLKLFKPDFEDCKFTVNGNKTITIQLVD